MNTHEKGSGVRRDFAACVGRRGGGWRGPRREALPMTARKESPMDRDHFDQHWWPLAQEVLTGMKEWRLQHPTATLSAIEAALDARLGRLRARMLADAALASAAATWSQESDHSRPPCPACGAPLQSRGEASRDLQTQAGRRKRDRKSTRLNSSHT